MKLQNLARSNIMRAFSNGPLYTLKKLTVLTVSLVLAGWYLVWSGDKPGVHTINAEIEKRLNAGQYQHVVDNYSGLHFNDAAFQNRLGYAHDMLGDYDRAIWYYRRATELSPDEPIVWRNLGIAYKNKGDLTKAVGVLQI